MIYANRCIFSESKTPKTMYAITKFVEAVLIWYKSCGDRLGQAGLQVVWNRKMCSCFVKYVLINYFLRKKCGLLYIPQK